MKAIFYFKYILSTAVFNVWNRLRNIFDMAISRCPRLHRPARFSVYSLLSKVDENIAINQNEVQNIEKLASGLLH